MSFLSKFVSKEKSAALKSDLQQLKIDLSKKTGESFTNISDEIVLLFSNIENEEVLATLVSEIDLLQLHFAENWVTEKITTYKVDVSSLPANNAKESWNEHTTTFKIGKKSLEEAGLRNTSIGNLSSGESHEYTLEKKVNFERLKAFVLSLDSENIVERIENLKSN